MHKFTLTHIRSLTRSMLWARGKARVCKNDDELHASSEEKGKDMDLPPLLPFSESKSPRGVPPQLIIEDNDYITEIMKAQQQYQYKFKKKKEKRLNEWNETTRNQEWRINDMETPMKKKKEKKKRGKRLKACEKEKKSPHGEFDSSGWVVVMK